MRGLRLLGITNLYPPRAGGGYGEICADIMSALAGRGHDVTMLVGEGESGGGVQVHADLEPVLAAWRRPRAALRATVNDQRVIERQLGTGVDAAVVWHMRGLVKSPLRVLHAGRIPVFYMVHDRWILYERPGALHVPWARMDRLGAGVPRELAAAPLARRVELRGPPIATDGIVCFVSDWLRREHARRGWVARNSHIVPCGIDPARFPPSDRPREIPPRRLLVAGRLDPAKGTHVAIDALEKLPDARLTLAGGGDADYVAQLDARAAALGVGDRVEMIGEVSRDDVARLLAEHDAFLYPSIGPEAYSLGLLEALAAGIPIVTSAVGGPREYLVEGRNALLFEPGDAEGLAAQVSRLQAVEVVETLAAGAAEAASRLSLDVVVGSFERLLQAG